MEGQMKPFTKFKTFLNSFFIRRKKEGFNNNDFKEDNFEYIQSYLDELLPNISMEEIYRINIYFHNAYIFHLNNGLGKNNNFTDIYMTPEIGRNENNEIEQSAQQESDALDNQPAELERVDTQLRTGDDCELYSQPEQTPLDSFDPIQTQQTGLMMQSTPLSIPLLPMGPKKLGAPQQEKDAQKENFTVDIISQMNFSPISTAAPAPVSLQRAPVEPESNVSFLRNFANIEREQLSKEPRRTRKRTHVGTVLRAPKKMMNKINFESLCNLVRKAKTNEQIKRADESFLYFCLLREKQINILNRSNTIIPEGVRGHISLQKINDMSNVLRAYASQNQFNSVEQPIQLSQPNSTRSPLTPGDLIRTSLPFTPLRGDISGFEPRMVIDQTTSFPTRSLLRQQPLLLTIPERDSSVLAPQNEGVFIDEAATISRIPREDMRNDIISAEQQAQHESFALNRSVLDIQALPEPVPDFPLEELNGRPSNVPAMNVGDLNLIEQTEPAFSLFPTTAQQSLAQQTEPEVSLFPTITQQNLAQEIETDMNLILTSNIPTQLHGSFPNQQLSNPENCTNNIQPSVPPIFPIASDQNSDHPFNWFEVLRPRGDFVEYPRENPPNRKRRKRRRQRSTDRHVRPHLHQELAIIPRSLNLFNGDELAIASDNVPNQVANNEEIITERVLNTPQQADSPPRMSSNEFHGISEQITQYPIQIEKQLEEYLELIKQAGRRPEYIKWERFDPSLFNENDNYELYTYIFKRIIKDNYVPMENLFERGTSRLEAARGFRFILDLKALGLIEIQSLETRILGIGLNPAISSKKF